MKKITVYLLALMLMFTSCASSKTFNIDGERVTVKPYGWANSEARKDDRVVYQVSAGNVIWSIIGVETIFLPVWLTGWQLFEPVKVKEGTTNRSYKDSKNDLPR